MEYHGYPLKCNTFFWAGEGPLHSALLGGYGCVSSHSSHLFRPWMVRHWILGSKLAPDRLFIPLTYKEYNIPTKQENSVHQKHVQHHFLWDSFLGSRWPKHKISQKRRLQKDLDISSFSKPSCCACRRSSQSSSQMSLGSVSLRSGQILVGHSNSEPWVGLSEILLFSVKTRWIFLKSWSFFWSVFVVVGGVKVLFCFFRF